nr:MAG TPA: hypothetical protein [Caudoviricetes sp.]
MKDRKSSLNLFLFHFCWFHVLFMNYFCYFCRVKPL